MQIPTTGCARRGNSMTKTVRVTSAQVGAAKLKIKRAAVTGRYVSPSIQAIANAKTATSANGTAPTQAAG